MNLGIDLGFSSTKLVVLDGKRMVHKELIENASKLIIEKRVRELALKYSNIRRIGITGGKSEFIRLNCSIPIRRIPEIEAISCGGLQLCGQKDGIVISCGTGTCITYLESSLKNVRHLGGTGVGGGTIKGLAKALIQEADIKKLERMSKKGILSRVDLLIGDIVGNSVGFLPRNVTASNFGKVMSPDQGDLTKGIFNLVAETIASVSVFAAKSEGRKSVIIVGRVPNITYLRRRMQMIFRICKIRPYIPKNSEYGTAVGAAMKAS